MSLAAVEFSMIGVVIFTVSSLLCGFSSNIYMLISFRALQAIGGGTLTPSATGIVSDHFGRGRDRAIGMFGTIATSGQVVGPVLGGLIVGYLSWRWIFYVNVPLGAALVILIRHIHP
jgi:MFS family permease